MTEPRRQLLAASAAATLGALVVVVFLLPGGEPLGYLLLRIALLLWAAVALSYVYAQWEHAAAPERDGTLRPAVDTYTLGRHEYTVSAAMLEGDAPLVQIVRSDELLHPEFAARLSPYFKDPALAFVQTATHYQDTGRVADAFYAQEALVQSYENAKNNLNAAILRGSGALISREALAAAYYPGVSFEELGLRLQALGYSSHFETAPLVLAAAPRAMHEYWPQMLQRAARAFALVVPALSVRHVPLATRVQYLSGAAAYGAVAATAAALAITPVAFIVRGAGPLVVSSVALPGLVFAGACIAIALTALTKISGVRVTAPAMLALGGVYAASYTGARAATLRAAAGYRRAVAIVRGGGSAGTAPAESPVRL